jgi:hypothetical protein
MILLLSTDSQCKGQIMVNRHFIYIIFDNSQSKCDLRMILNDLLFHLSLG